MRLHFREWLDTRDVPFPARTGPHLGHSPRTLKTSLAAAPVGASD